MDIEVIVAVRPLRAELLMVESVLLMESCQVLDMGGGDTKAGLAPSVPSLLIASSQRGRTAMARPVPIPRPITPIYTGQYIQTTFSCLELEHAHVPGYSREFGYILTHLVFKFPIPTGGTVQFNHNADFGTSRLLSNEGRLENGTKLIPAFIWYCVPPKIPIDCNTGGPNFGICCFGTHRHDAFESLILSNQRDPRRKMILRTSDISGTHFVNLDTHSTWVPSPRLVK